MPAQGIHAATGHADVAEQQLHHGAGRIICEPTECCVQPGAYMMVMTLHGAEVSAMVSQICSILSCGVPQMLLTTSGV